MKSFFRYISYIDLYNRNNKIKNVGFLRWKCQADKHFIEMQIKGADYLYGSFDIEEKNSKKRVGNIKLDQGIGNYTKQFSAIELLEETYLNVEDGQIVLSTIEGFYIWLSKDNYLYAPINLPIEKKENLKKQIKVNLDKEIESASENVFIDGIEEKYTQSNVALLTKSREADELYSKQNNRREISVETDREEIEKRVSKEENRTQMETLIYNKKTVPPIQERGIKTEEDNIKIIEPLHEDKWQQLSKKYPTVHPFSHQKGFLSIQPEDFIILQKAYQRLVNNSFLLHGFYNYGHLILGKLADEENAPLYIGVPGVYYDREKQAAQMFGFVGFESTEQPVQPGSYGYYMIEVMI